MKKSVFVVDNHPVILDHLTGLLNAQPDLAACGTSRGDSATLELIAGLQPNVIIVDLSLKHGHSLDLIREMRTRHPDLPIVVFSTYSDPDRVERALLAGANGYVTKQCPTEELFQAIRSVLRGEVYLSGELPAQVLKRFSLGRTASQEGPLHQLSTRELQVLELMGQGLSTIQVAARLSLAVSTIETYRERLKTKLGLEDGTALLRYAFGWNERGITVSKNPAV